MARLFVHFGSAADVPFNKTNAIRNTTAEMPAITGPNRIAYPFRLYCYRSLEKTSHLPSAEKAAARPIVPVFSASSAAGALGTSADIE